MGKAVLCWAALAPAAFAAVNATLVANRTPAPIQGLGAVEFNSATVAVYVDPSRTRWIAWNDTPTVSRTQGGQPGRTFLWGGGGFGIDDFLRLTVTNPQGASMTVDMDLNDANGAHRLTDPMNVIFGSAAAAPDSLRIDAFGQSAGTVRIFDEAGAFNAIFTTAGDYTFRFGFRNLGGAAAHADVFLLVDTIDNAVSSCLHFPAIPPPFSSIQYISQPNAAGDRLVVGRLADLRDLQRIPLPNSPNAAFCAPVQLASGQLFDAYVPTAAERAGDFFAFAAVLLDPRTGQPFPAGRIPASRLGDPFGWRIAIASPAAGAGLVLSQTGFTFTATSGGPSPPSRTLTVLGSPGALAATATVSTFSGQGWLTVTPSSGNTPLALTVGVNPAGLAPGDYYGEIAIAAPGAANSPQIVTVVFNVAAANVTLAPTVEPTGLLFTSPTGGPAPANQTIAVTNLGTAAVNFTTVLSFPGARWFTLAPAQGAVQPGAPVNVAVQQSNVTALATGVYTAAVTFNFSNGTTRVVALVLIVAPGGGSGLTASDENPKFRTAHSACNPTVLIPVSTLLASSFSTFASWPSALEALVADDCAHALTSGSVVATFNNGDAPVPLVHTGRGRWSGTWTSRNPRNADLVITLDAYQSAPQLRGTVALTGSAAENPDIPTITAGGLLGAASYTGSPAPGAIVSLFGGRMAAGVSSAPALPLPTDLAGSRLFVGGKLAPLIFTSDGQINAVLPYDVPSNTRLPVVVRRGARQSAPELVKLSPVQPAVFTVNQSGGGQGHIYITRPTGEAPLADAGNPAAEGDFLVIYAGGLGPVSPAVAAGVAAPLDPLSRTANEVTVTIDGVRAEVLFAGLTPGFTGLYQINVKMPRVVAAGRPAIVVIAVAGVTSPPVEIAVK